MSEEFAPAIGGVGQRQGGPLPADYTAPSYSKTDMAIAIGTIMGEALNESLMGKQAVADVIANRADFNYNGYGRGIGRQAGIAREFSTWSKSEVYAYQNAMRAKDAIERDLSPDEIAGKFGKNFADKFVESKQAFTDVIVTGQARGITRGSTAYSNADVTEKLGTRGWHAGLEDKYGFMDIGLHTFTGTKAAPFGLDPNYSALGYQHNTPAEVLAAERNQQAQREAMQAELRGGMDFGPPVWDGKSLSDDPLAAFGFSMDQMAPVQAAPVSPVQFGGPLAEIAQPGGFSLDAMDPVQAAPASPVEMGGPIDALAERSPDTPMGFAAPAPDQPAQVAGFSLGDYSTTDAGMPPGQDAAFSATASPDAAFDGPMTAAAMAGAIAGREIALGAPAPSTMDGFAPPGGYSLSADPTPSAPAAPAGRDDMSGVSLSDFGNAPDHSTEARGEPIGAYDFGRGIPGAPANAAPVGGFDYAPAGRGQTSIVMGDFSPRDYGAPSKSAGQIAGDIIGAGLAMGRGIIGGGMPAVAAQEPVTTSPAAPAVFGRDAPDIAAPSVPATPAEIGDPFGGAKIAAPAPSFAAPVTPPAMMEKNVPNVEYEPVGRPAPRSRELAQPLPPAREIAPLSLPAGAPANIGGLSLGDFMGQVVSGNRDAIAAIPANARDYAGLVNDDRFGNAAYDNIAQAVALDRGLDNPYGARSAIDPLGFQGGYSMNGMGPFGGGFFSGIGDFFGGFFGGRDAEGFSGPPGSDFSAGDATAVSGGFDASDRSGTSER